MRLSRIDVTGTLPLDTPLCVLEEISQAHGCSLEAVRRERGKDPGSTCLAYEVGCPPSRQERRLLAAYINRKTPLWNLPALYEALNFLNSFVGWERDPLELLPARPTFGPQTPENPRSVNLCLAYAICRFHRLPLGEATSFAQLKAAVESLSGQAESWALFLAQQKMLPPSLVARALLLAGPQLPDAPPAEEIAARKTPKDCDSPAERAPQSAKAAKKKNRAPLSHETLTRLFVLLNDIHEMRKRAGATTAEGAVALAAAVYRLDLSQAEDPLEEYRRLQEEGDPQKWQPKDPALALLVEGGRHLIDLSLTYNPLFPFEYYSPRDLVDMALAEGHSPEDLGLTVAFFEEDDPLGERPTDRQTFFRRMQRTAERLENEQIVSRTAYEMLYEAYLLETFHEGRWPRLTSPQTCIWLEAVASLPPAEVVCLGQRDSPMIPFTFQELAEYFSQARSFVHPGRRGEMLSPGAVRKLRNMCSEREESGRKNLLRAIDLVMETQRTVEGRIKQLGETYRALEREARAQVEEALRLLMVVGLRMRGWEGEESDLYTQRGQLPLEIALTKDENVYISVSVALTNFERQISRMGQLGIFLLGLPLLIYRDGVFNASQKEEYGLTLGDRLRLIKIGDDSDNFNSCIRMSSNWLCATAHKYMEQIEMERPFDIRSLRYIA